MTKEYARKQRSRKARSITLAIQLPPVKEYDPKGDPSTVSQRRQKRKKSSFYFLNATGFSNENQKKATLLHLVGEEVQDIFETLGEVGPTYDEVRAKLDKHFDIKGICRMKEVSSMKQNKT